MASSAHAEPTSAPPRLIAIDTEVTLAVQGEVDTVTAHDLERAAGNALRCAPRRLVLDLAGVTFVGASAIAALVRVRLAAHRRGTEIEIIHATPAVMRVLAHAGRGLDRDPAFALG